MGFTHAPRQHGIARYFFIITCSLVGGIALAGLIIGGSPSDVRRKKYDEMRLRDLQTIQMTIIEYWRRYGSLPASLAQITDDIKRKVIPIDPETKTEYFYQATGDDRFELCALFKSETSSLNDYERSFSKPVESDQRFDRYEGLNNDWTHDSGYWCFSRMIDQEYYRLYEKDSDSSDKP